MSALPLLVLSVVARFSSEPPTRGSYRKGLAETPCLALNHRNRTFQDNGGACGRTAGVDEQDQMSDMRRRPLSAANPHHVSQARVSGLVPKRYGPRTGSSRESGLSVASVHVLEDMSLQPFPVPEQGAERQGDLPMLVAFGPGRKRAGVSQYVAPVLDKLRSAEERPVQHQCASYRRHDATYLDTQSP